MGRDLPKRKKNPPEYPREVAGPFSGKEVSQWLTLEREVNGGLQFPLATHPGTTSRCGVSGGLPTGRTPCLYPRSV